MVQEKGKNKEGKIANEMGRPFIVKEKWDNGTLLIASSGESEEHLANGNKLKSYYVRRGQKWDELVLDSDGNHDEINSHYQEVEEQINVDCVGVNVLNQLEYSRAISDCEQKPSKDIKSKTTFMTKCVVAWVRIESKNESHDVINIPLTKDRDAKPNWRKNISGEQGGRIWKSVRLSQEMLQQVFGI